MAFKRTVTLRWFSISRYQIRCVQAIVIQRMYACACKMPSCFFPEAKLLLIGKFISVLKESAFGYSLCHFC